jgi:hypothetical protein
VKLVGFSSGTGYLCQRDTLGRMRGLMGERRSGMGAFSWSSLIPGEEAAGTILGAVIGGGSALYAANQQAKAAYEKANVDAATALRQQGTLAQQQAFQAQQTQVAAESFTKTAVTSAAIIGGLALAGFVAYMVLRRKS